MNKLIIFTLFLLVPILNISAQQVITAAGTSTLTAGCSVSYSVGQITYYAYIDVLEKTNSELIDRILKLEERI